MTYDLNDEFDREMFYLYLEVRTRAIKLRRRYERAKCDIKRPSGA